jgi:hypothetical protein
MPSAVVDPDGEAAIGRRQDVDVAVAVDIRRDNPSELDVIPGSHQLFESACRDTLSDTHLGVRRQRGGTPGRGKRHDDD